MNVIKYAIGRIKFEIPIEILNRAYRRQSDFVVMPESEEAVIERDVIRARCLTDLNVKHGITMNIDLSSAKATITDDAFSYVYDIPASLLNGRKLLYVNSVHFMDQMRLASYGRPDLINSSAMNRVSRAIVDSNGNIPTFDTQSMEVISDNSVLIRYGQIPQSNMYMNCTVTNDEDLNNIHPGTAPIFAKLCVEATKADIYRRLSISMDRSEMINGVSIGQFRAIIDGYADASKNYDDLLVRMTRAMRMNDLPTKQRLINYMMGRPRR